MLILRLYEGIFLFFLIFTHFLLIFYSLFAHLLLILDLLLVLFLAFLSHLDFSFFTLFQKVVLGNFAETGKGWKNSPWDCVLVQNDVSSVFLFPLQPPFVPRIFTPNPLWRRWAFLTGLGRPVDIRGGLAWAGIAPPWVGGSVPTFLTLMGEGPKAHVTVLFSRAPLLYVQSILGCLSNIRLPRQDLVTA